MSRLLSCVRLFVIPCTVAYQASLPMEFLRQEHWSGLPFPSPGDLPDPGIEPTSLVFPAPYHKHYLGSTSPPPNISLCFFLAVQRGLWDLSSLNRYGTSAPSSASTVLTTGPPVNSRGRISDAVYYPWILESSKGTGIPFVSLLGHHTWNSFAYYWIWIMFDFAYLPGLSD